MSTAIYASRRNQNYYRHRTLIAHTPAASITIGIVTVVILGLVYLFQITRTSSYNFERIDLTQEKRSLSAAQTEMEFEAARLRSVSEVARAASAAGLTAESGLTYVGRQ